MSTRIKLSHIDDEVKLKRNLTINLEKSRVCFAIPDPEFPYFKVPFSYCISKKQFKHEENFPKFAGQLRPEQLNIYENSLLYLLNNNVVMISCYTGFGKTITTLALACHLRLKTIIVVHRLCLIDQWTNSIKQFCLNSKTVLLPSSDENFNFGIVNIANLNKISKDVIDSIQLLITDETHLLLSEKRSINLLRLSPKILIGLTATPYRPDELDKAFKLFFGERFILKKLQKEHYIFVIRTNIKIIENKIYGKLDWNDVLKQQSENLYRNNLIIENIKKFQNRTWLVLVKRKIQAKLLFDLLKNDYKVSVLTGNCQTFDKDCNILIGTVGKIGTGFDHPKLDSLVIAADMVEYYIQFLGRIMRTDKIPIVLDLIDNHPILDKHFLIRKKVYLDHGGIIKTI